MNESPPICPSAKRSFLLCATLVTFIACDSAKTLPDIVYGDLSPLPAVAGQAGKIDSVAGARWLADGAWRRGDVAPARVATYFATPVSGDLDSAELRVNYFGPSQGGALEDNVLRWQRQFITDETTMRSATAKALTQLVGEIPLTTVEVSGVYLSSVTPMATEFVRKSGYTLFGAIVCAPGGSVFFKMTGPSATMEANRESFRKMLGSLKLLGDRDTTNKDTLDSAAGG